MAPENAKKGKKMPIYEFICNKCGDEFETILSSTDTSEVTCASCASKDVKKVLSATSFKVSGATGAAGSAPAGCGSSGFS
jgi:putative FmdB family regulatory protein